LGPLVEQGNPYASMLVKILSAQGQAFIKTTVEAFKKPGNQDVVVSLLAAVSKYFETITPEQVHEDEIESICSEAEAMCCGNNEELNKVVAALEDSVDEPQKYLRAMLVLACLSVKLVNPIFARTDAIGTVMRKKIKPVTDPIIEQLKVLQDR